MKSVPIAMFVVAVAALAQAPAPPEFEVASVKPSNAASDRSSTRLTPGALFIENATLRKCIALAWGISEDRESGISAPDWLESVRFDVVARFPPTTPETQVRAMFQNLLADRFRLKVHRESRERNVYALVAGKSGPKLTESQPGIKGTVSMAAGRLTAHAAPVTALADRLSGAPFQLGRPVVDHTGLKGLYDFSLAWTPEAAEGQENAGPSLFTALDEQLGLKLEARKEGVEVLVVDSAEKKPAEN